MALKAIETRYKGYRFRSRLEARWAVFFDGLGWEWDYETEGFELEAGRYLPDFYIKELDRYIEIKPKLDDPFAYEPEARWVEFNRHKKISLVSGNPWPQDHYVFFDIEDRDFFYNEFSLGRRCDHVCLLITSDEYGLHGERPFEKCICGDCINKWAFSVLLDKNHCDDSRVGKAYNAARSARFEHGECGGLTDAP